MNLQVKVYETPKIIHEGNIGVRAGTPPPGPRGKDESIDLFGDD